MDSYRRMNYVVPCSKKEMVESRKSCYFCYGEFDTPEGDAYYDQWNDEYVCEHCYDNLEVILLGEGEYEDE